MSEEKKILEMIEKGQISAEEGMELLKALRDVDQKVEVVESPMSVKTNDYKFLKIRVITVNGETKVNINIPLKLIKALGGILPQVNNIIPEDIKIQMGEKGINLSSIDFKKILEEIELGELEDTVLVDIETYDKKDGKTQVKIYVE